MQLTITDAQNYDKKKDNTPILDSKTGAQKYRSVIKTVEKGNTQLTGFVYKPLAKGDVIEAEVSTEVYNGQTQYRFNMKTSGRDMARGSESNSAVLGELKTISAILKNIFELETKIERHLMTEGAIKDLKEETPADEFQFDDEDLPDLG